MKITKKESLSFVKNMTEELIKINAVPFISDSLQFDLKTKFGILWIRIDEDNHSCFTVYARFVDVKKMPKNVINVNSHSGKYNHHISGNVDGVVRSIILDFKNLLN